MQRRPQKLTKENRLWIGVTYGMRGWYAVLYEVSPNGNYLDVIQTGIGSYPTPEGARMEAEEWSAAEEIPVDFLGNENQQETNMSDQPKPIPFKRILNPDEFSDGDIVKCVHCKIKKLFSKIRKGGDGDRKYEFQDGVVVDEDGTEMSICFSKNTQPQSAEGKWVTIRSKKTEAHGTQGVKFEINEWEDNGETKRKKLLKVTGSAEIEYVGGGGGAASSSGGSSSTQQQSSGQHSPGPAKSNAHPKDVLRDMLDCHHTIALLVNEKYGDGASPEFKQGAVNTLFIESAKSGLIPDFAKRYSKKVYPAPPKDPANWKECVMSSGQYEGKTLAEIPDDDLLKYFEYYDKKEDNSPLAECIYQAARDRNILPKPEPPKGQDPDLDPPAEDDIPF